MEILQNFGINFPAFVAQVFIILVVYIILKKYAFGPVLAMLEHEWRKNLTTVDKTSDA